MNNFRTFRSADYSIFVSFSFKILLGAFIAFFMEVTEVMVVTYTSSLTLSIAGIFKVKPQRSRTNLKGALF